MSWKNQLPAEYWSGLLQGEERGRDLGLISSRSPRLDEDDDDLGYYIIPHPMVYEETERGSQRFDLYSRLLRDRIIFMGSEVNDRVANLITAQLLFLETQDPDKDVNFYINSPGGSISAGMGVYDTMQLVRCDVATVCIGQAASMGSFLLCAGAKGKRGSLPHSRIMIHQPAIGTIRGQVTDLNIQYQEMMRVREMVYGTIAKHCGRPFEQVAEACYRDNFMSPAQARDFGLIDNIIERQPGVTSPAA